MNINYFDDSISAVPSQEDEPPGISYSRIRDDELDEIPLNPWHVDSIQSAEEDYLDDQMEIDDQMDDPDFDEDLDQQMALPKNKAHKKQTRLEIEIQALSAGIDEQLRLANIDCKKLQEMVYKIIQALGRKMAKDDQETVFEMGIKITITAVKIQETYNPWKGVTVTVISAVVSISGGVFGLAPIFSFFPAELAKTLSLASQGIGSAGTSLSGIAQIFNNASEAERGVIQNQLKRLQDKEEDKKGAKHGHKEMTKDAAKNAESADQMWHQIFSEMARAS